MCIICYKPEGVDMPTEEDIRWMFSSNKDGAGYAIQGYFGKKNKFDVRYKKGFMTVEALLASLKAEGDLKEKAVAIHCRIGTAGKNDEATTHPFPLTRNYSHMRRTQGHGEPVLFHNGVMVGLGGGLDPDSSDTQDFVGTCGVEFLVKPKMPSKAQQMVISSVISDCRLLVMYPNPNFRVLQWGTWHEHNGLFYSNMGYRGAYKNYPAYSLYDDDDWYDEYYRDKYSQHDAFGCNIAEWAYPSSVEHWIRCKTLDRFNNIFKRATVIEDDGSYIKKVTFDASAKIWYANYVDQEFYDEQGQTMKKKAEDTLLKMSILGIDPSDHMIQFSTEDEAIEWADMATLIEPNVFRFLGRKWWFDEMMLEAYDEEGIKMFFSTGVQGHVKKEIEAHGTYAHNKSITDDIQRQIEKEKRWMDEYNEYKELEEGYNDLTDDGIRVPDAAMRYDGA